MRDCQLLREHLGVERWSLLGQSFGGFTSLTYLSPCPQDLASVLITGGLGGGRRAARRDLRRHVRDHAGQVGALLPPLPRRPRPDARARSTSPATAGCVLPDGDLLTPRLLRTVGSKLGMDGGAERLHHLLELDPTSPAFA